MVEAEHKSRMRLARFTLKTWINRPKASPGHPIVTRRG